MIFEGLRCSRGAISIDPSSCFAFAGTWLSLRDLKEMMAERGIGVDHSTIHRWVVRFSPLLLERAAGREVLACCNRYVDNRSRFSSWP
jgi:hypothetical protein